MKHFKGGFINTKTDIDRRSGGGEDGGCGCGGR